MPESEYEPRRARRAKIALAIAAALTIAAVGGGAAFAMTSAAVVAEHEAESGQLVELPAVTETPPTAAPPSSDAPADGAEASAGDAGESDASPDAGFPIYDADTDIATIPRPADDPDPANTEIWLTQQRIIAQCMREQGFEYRYTAYWLVPGDQLANRDDALGNQPYVGGSAYSLAIGGDTGGGDDYRWEDAGCTGYAVHVTGMDDAH